MPTNRLAANARACARLLAHGVVALAGAVILQCLLDPALREVAQIGSAAHLRLLLTNALPVALVGLLVYAATARPVFAAALTALLLCCAHAANALKLLHLGLPLLPADLRALGHGGLLARYLSWPVLVAPLLALAVAALALWRERPQAALRPRRRALSTLALVALGVSLLAGRDPWPRLYERGALQFEPWSPVETVSHAGLLPGLLLFHWELGRPPALPASHDGAQRFIAARAADLRAAMHGARAALPDIVVVQSESFFDPERLRGMPPGSLPHYRALAQFGASGELRVPTYAGGTVRTEFEVLTGLALRFFPGIEYPYFELLDHPVPSLPRTLAQLGYRTTAIHTHDGSFWNRARALRQLGIERFIAGDAFRDAPLAGLFVADSVLTDRVLAELRDDGPPQFVFAVSMEAHGPYEVRPGLDRARLQALALPPGLGDYAADTLRHYLYHLDDADRELGRLAAALMARERLTLLLFYGDHLPGLHASFAATGFVDGRGPREQTTPWLLLDNTTVVASRDTLHAWQLPVRLLAAAGVREDAYFALLDVLHDAIAAADDGADVAFSDALGELAQLRLADEFDAIATASLREDADAGPLPEAEAPALN